jgi:hypothetical protein
MGTSSTTNMHKLSGAVITKTVGNRGDERARDEGLVCVLDTHESALVATFRGFLLRITTARLLLKE